MADNKAIRPHSVHSPIATSNFASMLEFNVNIEPLSPDSSDAFSSISCNAVIAFATTFVPHVAYSVRLSILSDDE